MIKVLFTDIGGVCCDNPYRTMSAGLNSMFGIPEATAMAAFVREAVYLDRGDIDFRSFHARVISDLGIQVDFEHFEAMHMESLSLKSDVCSLVKEVSRKNGVRLVALSNMPEYTWRLLDEKYRLAGMFDDAILSYSCSVVKPDAAIFAIALRKEGVDASESLFIDDRKENVEEAGRIGIQSILFSNCEQLKRDLSINGLTALP